MTKSYVIQNMETMLFLKPMSTTEYGSFKQAGTWDTENSALSWIQDIKNIHFCIFPVYIKY